MDVSTRGLARTFRLDFDGPLEVCRPFLRADTPCAEDDGDLERDYWLGEGAMKVGAVDRCALVPSSNPLLNALRFSSCTFVGTLSVMALSIDVFDKRPVKPVSAPKRRTLGTRGFPSSFSAI